MLFQSIDEKKLLFLICYQFLLFGQYNLMAAIVDLFSFLSLSPCPLAPFSLPLPAVVNQPIPHFAYRHT